MSKLSDLYDTEQSFDGMHLDKSDFDSFHATLATIAKTNPAQAKALGVLGAAVSGLQKKSTQNEGMTKETIEGIMMGCDASYYIAISRTTANILATANAGGYTIGTPVSLPFAIYGQNDYQSGYSQSLQASYSNIQAAVPGIKYTVTTSMPGNVIFTWTAGDLSDIVTVYFKGKLQNYLSILTSQNQERNVFKACYINYAINDATNGEQQLSQADIQFISISSAGGQQASELVADSLLLTSDYRNDRINVCFPWTTFNANLSIVDQIIPCPAADIASHTPFVVSYYMFIYWKNPALRASHK
jgi:hypothetical protein